MQEAPAEIARQYPLGKSQADSEMGQKRWDRPVIATVRHFSFQAENQLGHSYDLTGFLKNATSIGEVHSLKKNPSSLFLLPIPSPFPLVTSITVWCKYF